MYLNLNNYKLALKYFNQSRNIVKDLHGNCLALAEILSNIGSVYNEQKKYDSAIKKYKKSLIMYRSIITHDDHSAIANILFNMGYVYEKKKEYGLAPGKLEHALDSFRKIFKTERNQKIVKSIEKINSIQNLIAGTSYLNFIKIKAQKIS